MLNQLENNKSYLGFTNGKTALQKSKIENCLDKVFRYNEGVMMRKDAMLNDLRAGKQPKKVTSDHNGRVKNEYRLSWDNFYNDITKTEYDFCLYLIDNDLVTEDAVNAYINKEQEERAAEEKKTIRRRKRQLEAEAAATKEREEFEAWLYEESKKYEGTEEGELVERIYTSMYDSFLYPYKAFELLVYINHIEKPLCREGLKSRLHYDNKASRKVFTCITGLKLPSTNKETMSFLDTLQKEDYCVKIEYKERKKAEKKEVKKETFYCHMRNREGKGEYQPVSGEALRRCGVDLFLHKTLTGDFAVSSVECGLRIAVGKTKTELKRNLDETLKKYGDVLSQRIAEAVKEFGESPYVKQA